MADLISQFLGNVSSKSNITVEMERDPEVSDGSDAYVTLLTNDNFYPGVDALCKSIRAVNSAFPIYILLSYQVSDATKIRLQSICNGVIPVESIMCPYKGGENEVSWTNSELTKLNIWNLTQFRKVVYLDADTLLLENIDELFSIESTFAAAPDIFPPDKFNAGVMVIEPDATIFEEMVSLVGVLPSHDGGDTGFLNSYFSSWYTGRPESRLSFGYNAQRTLYWFTYSKQPGYWKAINPLKIIHYSSSPKPWEMSPNAGNLGELEFLWWRMYMGV